MKCQTITKKMNANHVLIAIEGLMGIAVLLAKTEDIVVDI